MARSRRFRLQVITLLALIAPLLVWLARDARPSGRARAQELLYPKEVALQPVSMDAGAPMPEYRTRTLEPAFGTRITRVSDAVETPRTPPTPVIRHHYSRTQEWNSDGTLMMMGNKYLLDGKTYQKVGTYAEYSSETFWSRTEPNVMYAFRPPRAADPTNGLPNPADAALLKVTLSKAANGQWSQTSAIELRTFPYAQFPEMFAGRWESRLSEDDRYLALMGRMGTTLRVLVVDITQPGVPDVALHDFPGMWPSTGPLMDWCSVSPSGKYVVVSWHSSATGSNRGVEVYRLPAPSPTAALIYERRLADVAENGDLCWEYNAAGAKLEETWVQLVSGSQEGVHAADLVAWRLRTGDLLRIVARPTNPPIDFPGHVSCTNYKRPGWAYVTAANDASSSPTAVSQVFAIKLQDTPSGAPVSVQSFALHRSNSQSPYDYSAQPHATVDPSGQKVLFASNWFGGSSSNIYSYVAERPNPIQLLPNAQAPTQVIVSSATNELRFYRQQWQALTLRTPGGTDFLATDLIFYLTHSPTASDQVPSGYWMDPAFSDLSVTFQTLPTSATGGSTAVVRADRSPFTKTAYITVYPEDPLAYVVVRLATDRPLLTVYDNQLAYVRNQPDDSRYASEIYIDGTPCVQGQQRTGRSSALLYFPQKQASLGILMAPPSEQRLRYPNAHDPRPIFYQYTPAAGSNMSIRGIAYQPLNPGEVVEYRYALYWNDDWQLEDFNRWATLMQQGDLNDRFRTECDGSGPCTVCGDGVLSAGEVCDIALESGCSTDCGGYLTTASTEIACTDGVDNDGDGLVDCGDMVDCGAAGHCAACGDGVVSGSEVCDPALDAWCNHDCTSDGELNLDCSSCGPGQACPSEPNGTAFDLEYWRYVCVPVVYCGESGNDCGTAGSPCGRCACAPNCSTKSCGDDPNDGCGGVCRGFCQAGEIGVNQDTDCPAGHVMGAGNAWRFGHTATPDENVCWPVACEDVDPRRIECGTTTSPCGLCDPQVAAHCFDGVLCDNSPSVQCPEGSAKNMAGQCIGEVSLGLTDEIDTAEVGALPGAFAVGPRGTATYTVPVEVPPGRAGLTPRLSIDYDSGSLNSAVGYGWRVSGFSVISTCNATVAQDNTLQPNQAHLCLDGKRLVPVGTFTSDAGAFTHWATEQDTFVRVLSPGNLMQPGTGDRTPSVFLVYNKNGTIARYGADDSAKLGGRVDISDQAYFTTRTWAVSEIADRAGNIVRFSYARNFTQPNVELVPKWIGYNFVTPASAQATNAVNEIVFTYAREGETLPARCSSLSAIQDSSCDGFPASGWEAVGDRGPSRLLQYITVHAHGRAVRQYRLRHTKAVNGLSMVRRITECTFSGAASEEHCRPETSFTYEDVNLAFPDRLYVAPSLTQQVLTLDWNNDGYDDLARFQSGQWQMFPGNPSGGLQFDSAAQRQSERPVGGTDERGVAGQPAFVTDFDADGYDDLIVQAKDAQGRAILERFESTSAGAQPIAITWPSGAKSVASFHPVDINGDEVDDLVYCDTSGKAYLYINEDGAGLSGPISIENSTPPSALFGDAKGCGDAVIANFRDGRETLFFGNTKYIAQTGPASYRFADSPVPPSATLRLQLSADFNGDGLLDLFYIPVRAPFQELRTRAEIYYGTGTTWTRGPTLDNADLASARMVSSLDYDLDGRADLLVGKASGSATQWLLYRGIDLRAAPLVLATFTGVNQNLSAVFLDANGDGRVDIYANGDGGLFLGRSPAANRLNVVSIPTHTQAVPDRINVSYATGRAPLVFTPGEANTCDDEDPRTWCSKSLPFPVVLGVTRTSYIQDAAQAGAIAQYSHEAYRYQGSVFDRGGYGWLGFLERTAQYTGLDGLAFQEVVDEYAFDSRDATFAERSFYYYPFGDLAYKTTRTWEVPASAIMVEGSFQGREETVRTFEVRTSARGLEFTTTLNEEVVVFEGEEIEHSTTTYDVDAYGNVLEEETLWPSDPERREVRGFRPLYASDPSRIAKWQINLMDAAYSLSTVSTGGGSVIGSSDTYSYDANGLLEAVLTRGSPQTPEDALLTTIVRDAWNNPFAVTQHPVARGEDTTFDRNWFHYHDLIAGVYLSQSWTPEGHVHQYEHSYADGRLRHYVDPNFVESTWSYDGFGRVLEERNQTRGIATNYTYGPASWSGAELVPVNGATKVVSTTFGAGAEAEGIPVEAVYDTAGRLVQETTRGFQDVRVSSEFAYDSLGRRVSASRPHLAGDATQGVHRTQYDGLGRVLSETAANGEVTSFHYASSATAIDLGITRSDARWFIAADSQRTGRTLRVTDSAKRLVVVREGGDPGAVGASGTTIQYDYGAADFLRTVIDAHGNRIEREPDLWGRLKVSRDPDEGERSYTYTPWDEIKTATHQGASDEYTYDGLGRPKTLTNADGTTVWTWDQLVVNGEPRTRLGELLKIVGPDGHDDEFFYSGPGGALDRVSRTLAGSGAPLELGIEYDSLDRVETIHYPGASGLSVRYEYEPGTGVLTSARDLNGGQGEFWRLESAYQGLRPSTVRLGDGSSNVHVFEALTGATSDKRVQGGAGNTLVDVHVERYEDGAVRFVQRRENANDPGRFYVYDRLGRLDSVHGGADANAPLVASYAYNQIGNIQSKPVAGTYTYGLPGEAPDGPQTLPHAVRQVSGPGGINQYFYDAFGRVERRTGPSVPGGDQEFTYTANGSVRTIESPGRLDRFEYSGMGERVRRTVSSGPTIAYLDPFYEARDEGETTLEKLHVIVNGTAVAEIAVRDGVAAGTTYLHRDHLSSVVAKTGGEFGVFEYDEYGGAGPGTADADVGEIAWTGHRGEADLGLVDMKARFYDPLIGRFLSPDPLIPEPSKTQAYNRYAYVDNNPATMIDPSGFCGTDATDPSLGCPLTDSGGQFDQGGGTCTGNGCKWTLGGFVGGGIAIGLWKAGVKIKERLEKKRANKREKERAKKERQARSARSRPSSSRANSAPLASDDGNWSMLGFANWLDHSGVAYFVAGWGDNVSFGVSSRARNWLGSEGVVDESSVSYAAGSALGTANSLVAGGSAVLKAVGWVKSAAAPVIKATTKAGVWFASKVAARGGAQAGRRLFEYVCFAAGTEIHTAAGLKAIEDVEVGDLVWSRDDETGELALRRVVRTFVTPDKPLLAIVVAGEEVSAEELKVTGEHPFWVRDRGWTKASELAEGDELPALGGGWLRVSSTSQLEKRETVYNLEVEGFHTYFVGEVGAWVHNTCWDDIAKHVLDRGRFAGQTQQQVAQYLRTFAESATPTTVASGARIWRRGAEILIQRPGAGAGGTWFRADSVRAAERRLQRFIVEEGGISF